MLTDNRSSVSDARVLDVAMLAVQARCYIDFTSSQSTGMTLEIGFIVGASQRMNGWPNIAG